MKRPVTRPNLLDEILGGAAPVGPATAATTQPASPRLPVGRGRDLLIRQETPAIDDLPAPFISTQNARALLTEWQQGDATEQAQTLAALQPPALSGLPAIDAVHLTPAVYRTAVRLLARAEPSGVLFISPEESAAVFGNEDYGAQRAHLYRLKRAGLIDYSHCAGWFVRFLAPLQNRAVALQNGNGLLQNGAPTLQNGAEEWRR